MELPVLPKPPLVGTVFLSYSYPSDAAGTTAEKRAFQPRRPIEIRCRPGPELSNCSSAPTAPGRLHHCEGRRQNGFPMTAELPARLRSRSGV